MEFTADLHTRFKEILYRCLEEIQATKAALYLRQDDESFQVATQYGFRKGLRDRVEAKDEIVDALLMKRVAYAVNGLAEDPRFSEFLYDANTSKILAAPIYSRGKVVGFLDMRDKAGGKDFDPDDLATAMAIAEEFLEVFTDEGMYGQRKIALGDMSEKQRGTGGRDLLAASAIVKRAAEEISRGVLLEGPSIDRGLAQKFTAATEVLPAFLGLRSIAIAAVSAFSTLSDTGGQQYVVAKGDVLEESLEQFRNRLLIWLERRGEEVPYLRTQVEYPFGKREYRVTPERITNLLAAPVRAAEPQTMIVSVVFDQNPDEETRGDLERLHNMLEQVVENAAAARQLAALRERVAINLLESDLEVYPDLTVHAHRVSELSVKLAKTKELPSTDLEDIRLAALVHDVGLRLLGYHRVHRKGRLSEEEMKMVRQHPVVGAAIVARSALGSNVGRIVYAHHERADGTGYPDSISGDRIPLGSRIIHICETYDVLTSDHSYKKPVGKGEALKRIRVEAGKQFDADLVDVFCTMMENS